MSLFGARKQTPPLKELHGRAKENFEKRMAGVEGAITVSSEESSHIGDLLKENTGLPTDPDGTATTSEVARKELGDYLAESQPALVMVSREAFNHGIRIQKAEMRAEGLLSQVMEPVLGAIPCDEYGNTFSQEQKIHTISSDDGSSLTSPPTTIYVGSEISFPSNTPREAENSLLRFMRVVLQHFLLARSQRILFRFPGRALESMRRGRFSRRKIPANMWEETIRKKEGLGHRKGPTHPFWGNSKWVTAATLRMRWWWWLSGGPRIFTWCQQRREKSAIWGRELRGRQCPNDQSHICCRHLAAKNLQQIGPSLQRLWPMRMNWQIWESVLVRILETLMDWGILWSDRRKTMRNMCSGALSRRSIFWQDKIRWTRPLWACERLLLKIKSRSVWVWHMMRQGWTDSTTGWKQLKRNHPKSPRWIWLRQSKIQWDIAWKL